jgi:PAP2 superfamily
MASPSQTDTSGELAVVLPDALGRSPREQSRVLAAVQARPRWWVELLTIAWLAWVYDAINNLAPLNHSVAFAHGRDLLSLEQTLHLTPEVTLNRWLASHQTLGTVLSNYYDNAHFIVTLGLLGWLWWKRADIYRPLRTALVLMNVLGLAVFWLYPVAPPRMLAGFSDVVARTSAFASFHTGSLAHAANQYAAMPSLHMAWAVWCSLVMWKLSAKLWVRVAAIVYPCLTCVAVLSTGNHYLVDVVAGVLTAVLAVALVRPVTAAGVACHKLVTKSRIG